MLSLPKNLKVKLYPHQIHGFKWMFNHLKNNRGCLLAHDMGLGKTLQVITLILHLKNNNYLKKKPGILIIVPITLVSNWIKEFTQFAPDISIHCYNRTNRHIKNCDVIIVPYSLIDRDVEIFNQYEWLLIILDEAHNIKNPQSRRTQAINTLQAKSKIALTGTPIINSLMDYWSLFNFINPGYLGCEEEFLNYIMKPIEYFYDKEAYDVLIKITQPFVSRKLKTILKNLPKKTIIDCFVNLTKKQSKLYEATFRPEGPLFLPFVEQMKGINHLQLLPRQKVQQPLISITYAKHLCNHPSQFFYEEEKKKLYTQSTKTIDLIKIIKKHKNERGLVFTQVIMHHLLIELLEKEGIKVLFLHGKCTLKERDDIVNEFQNPLSKVKILLISLFTGGIGLNLTAATYVIHFDLWWNSALEDQASDRAHRIGQKHPVTIYRFITKDTWEEGLNTIIQRKRQLINVVLNKNKSHKFKTLTKKTIKKILEAHINKYKIKYE